MTTIVRALKMGSIGAPRRGERMSVRKLVLYSEYICASASTALCTLCVHDVVYGGEDHQEPSHEDNDAHIYHRKQTRNIRK